MPEIRFYEIQRNYIDFLSPQAPLLFHNSKQGQKHERKYIGILLTIHGMNYFAPLSSFKPKHLRMKNSLDFIKVKEYAVINLNNMFPAPLKVCTYVDFDQVRDEKYRMLLLAEYRIIKSMAGKLLKNAATLYAYKVKNAESTPLARRCNDFLLLEDLCRQFDEK